MIVEWFLSVVVSIWEALTGALPSFDPPAWLTDSDGLVTDILGYTTSMGAWVPMDVGLTVFAAILLCMVIGFGIKIVRIVASFLTAGGGSAA